MQSFKEFMNQRRSASDAFVNGDIEPLLEISPENGTATIFPPNGHTVVGAKNVNGFNTEGADTFEPGGENTFEPLHQAESGDLAYWTGLQRSKVRMKGHAEPVPMVLRISEIFRREAGAWKLIHRHADPFKGAS